MAHYLRENFYITTSGNFRSQALTDVILEVGADRVLYSVDYPFEDVVEAEEWFDQAAISDADRLKIARSNAQKLFHPLRQNASRIPGEEYRRPDGRQIFPYWIGEG